MAHIAVEIERLWITEIGIGHVGRFVRPIWRHEPAEAAAVVAGTEHIQAGLAIAFFAGELVAIPKRCAE